jgi:4-hydroxy 2-oxovalerate aldolase
MRGNFIMQNIKILDCTLRDGGYINDWNFGERTIKKIIKKLSQSHIDIIECGFIEDINFNRNKTLFNSIEIIKSYIEPKNKNVLYVGMIAYPYISIDKISPCDGTSIDGIRLTFHEDEIEEALLYGKQLMDKGYKVFIQPVGTTSYSDASLIELINKVNNLKPYAFYLVDTLGIMYKNDLLRMFHLLDNNLDKSISIGFHSHNNLQLSFSNAQELLMLHTKREIIIDSTVFGMGRGAGNLCTELVTQYINENISHLYETLPLLEIYDEHLSKLTDQSQWGYSIPYYLAAVTNCHPNYATYLINKQTISVKSISNLLNQIPIKKRDLFDKHLIEDLYIRYQMHHVDDTGTIESIKQLVGKKRKILILAPGASIDLQKEELMNFINIHNPFVISVNFVPGNIDVDAVFISNSKRFGKLTDYISEMSINIPIITTSNISDDSNFSTYMVNYSDLLNQYSLISDNAGLMLINLLNRISFNSIYLAGFDGFNLNRDKNYFSDELSYSFEKEELIKKNEAIRKYFVSLKKYLEINFVTESIYSETDQRILVYNE